MVSTRTYRVGLLVVAALSWRAGLARAQAPLALTWVRGEGAEACVSGAELEAKLRDVMTAASIPPTPLIVEGVVERQASGDYRVYLHVLSEQRAPLGARELHSAQRDCALLTPSIVLVLSFLIELGSRGDPQALDVGPPARVAPPAPVVLRPPPTAAAAEPAAWQLEARAVLALALGLTPQPALGPALGLHLRTPWSLTLLLQAGYWPDTRKTVSTKAAEVGVDVSVTAVDLTVCLPVLRTSGWWLAACWGPDLILRRANMFGLPDARDTLRATLGADAAIQLAYAVTEHWSLAFNASLFGLTRRTSYVYERADGTTSTLYRTSQLAGVLGLGLGFRP